MRSRPPVVAVLLSVLAVAAVPPGAVLAQSELDGPPAGAAPQPLWVPDPQEPVVEAAPVADVELAVTAPAAPPLVADDDPSLVAVAHWMANGAREAGLPGELPVMAALVESGLRNLPYGHADSVGFFQMRASVWDAGPYEGYLARPELQLRWFVDQALAVRAARVAAGDAEYGVDPSGWGAWIADVERPYEAYRGRYQTRLAQARALLALPDPGGGPFELGLTVGGEGLPDGDPTARALADEVLADAAVTLDERARADLLAGRVDPRVVAVLAGAAAQTPIAVTVVQTGHSYYTVNGTVSNHSFGRAVDIGSVGGAPVSPTNEAARQLALALGRLPEGVRPTEIGTPWEIDAPGYFTDGDHQDHLHVGFDDPLGAGTAVAVAASAAASKPDSPAAAPPAAAVKPVAPRSATEPAFDATRRATAARVAPGGDEPRFEVKR